MFLKKPPKNKYKKNGYEEKRNIKRYLHPVLFKFFESIKIPVSTDTILTVDLRIKK